MVLSNDIVIATSDGDIRGVEAALAAGDDVNDDWGEGTTLMAYASSSKGMPHEDARTGMIRFLLENGADPHVFFPDACHRMNADQVRLFFEHGVNVNARNEHGFLPLGYAVRNDGHSLQVCRLLLQQGARADALLFPGNDTLTVVKYAIISAKKVPKYQPAADLLAAVQDAGSWHRYCVEPSVKLLALRYLSLAGRAVPPRNLLRLFGAPRLRAATGCASRTRSKRPRSVDAPPTEVFQLILEFWGGNHR